MNCTDNSLREDSWKEDQCNLNSVGATQLQNSLHMIDRYDTVVFSITPKSCNRVEQIFFLVQTQCSSDLVKFWRVSTAINPHKCNTWQSVRLFFSKRNPGLDPKVTPFLFPVNMTRNAFKLLSECDIYHVKVLTVW